LFKISSISGSEFTKNTFILVIGTVIAQCIPLILHPFLRRIYSPEDFGAMAVYLNIFSMLTIVSSLRYEAAIVLPKHNNEAANILSLSFLINLGFSFVMMLSLVLFRKELAQLINFPEKYSGFLYFLPLASLIFGIYQSMNYWLIRQKAFKDSTRNKIIRRGVEGVAQTGLGVWGIPGGLFIGDLMGNLANGFAGLRQIFRNGFRPGFVSSNKMKFVFNKFIDFPKYNVLPTLLSSAAGILPFLFINKMYSTETVGYLDLSRLVLSIPLIFVSSTISQVFFQHAAAKKHESKSMWKDIRNILMILILVILLEVFIILLFGPVLFGFVFGERYVVSGFFSRILIFSFMLNFIGSTFSSLFIIHQKIRLNSIWQIVYFFAICSLLLFKGLDIYSFLKIFVAIEVIMHLSYFVLIDYIVRNYEHSVKTKLVI
jgi:O-antigen/teichoic acid export membrane protein